MEVGAWNNRAHLGMFQPYQNQTQSGEEDLWEYFPCPFCCIEVEVPFLSSHLQEEHCFDFKNAVCPMCADTPGKDMISHFTIHHSHQIKRRKSHRSSLWNQNSSTVYEDSFSEMAPNRGTVYGTESAADPLLSQFICTVAPINSDLGKVNHTSEMISVSSHDMRSVAHAVENLGEEDLEERVQRVEFVRQMLISTIF
ncbi:protein DEHYDRATION-INDUCED 19 6-like protein [Carex littledalei]|uniref:Protein DEHYDRATION-INDUCED 19 6-like protein n=1 Tax=Carex littledalei TaxID=544730 RepID=A0A833VQK1_9POAL|nr:protein DEHYDRATION-INDUCED 19 6-like protein [Carex littledalei]